MIDTKKARELGTNGIGVPDLTEAAALLLQLSEAHDRMARALQYTHRNMTQLALVCQPEFVVEALKDAAMGAERGKE